MTNVIDSTIANRDYVVVVDKSGSMSATDCPGKKSRWAYCQESVAALARKVCELDPDGIDLYFFNAKFTRYQDTTADMVDECFKKETPMGSTMFAPVLADIFKNHFSKAKRPTTVLFITDGEAGDAAETCKELITAANKLEVDAELAISFIQVGRDVGAKIFLKKLDDDLQGAGAKFDIVDTKTMDELEEKPLEEILFDAIMD